jgi:orc1/cdc6 family replication initiation protein
MIRDARVLQPDFVPSEVQHREGEVDALSNALSPVAAGDVAETAMLFGPSGTGKTCIARFTTERLRKETVGVRTGYVNCWQDYSRFRVLYRVLEGLGRAADVHRRSTPKDELLERLRTYEGPPYVVVLDEVDQLEDPRVLYDLYRTPLVSMVTVANREADLFVGLDDRLTSRLRAARRIMFDKYGIDALTAILEARVEWGLTEGAVARADLEFVADAAAGDARIAIGILRSATREAEREGLDTVPTELVREAVPAGRREVRRATLDRLTDHQRTVYDIVVENGEVDPGELYGQYQERVERPKTKRTVRNYLSKMVQYDLVVASGENRGRTYLPADPEAG